MDLYGACFLMATVNLCLRAANMAMKRLQNMVLSAGGCGRCGEFCDATPFQKGELIILNYEFN